MTKQIETKIYIELEAENVPNTQRALIELMKAGLHSPNHADYQADLLAACDLLLLIQNSSINNFNPKSHHQ